MRRGAEMMLHLRLQFRLKRRLRDAKKPLKSQKSITVPTAAAPVVKKAAVLKPALFATAAVRLTPFKERLSVKFKLKVFATTVTARARLSTIPAAPARERAEYAIR